MIGDLIRLPHRTVGPGQRAQLSGGWRALGMKAPRWAIPGEIIPGHISHHRLRRNGRLYQLELRPPVLRG